MVGISLGPVVVGFVGILNYEILVFGQLVFRLAP